MPRYLDYQILNQDKIIGEGHISNIKRRLTNRRWRQYIPQKFVDIELKLAKPEAIYGVQFKGYDIHQVQISFKDQNKKEITKMKYLLNFSDQLIDCVLEATQLIHFIDVKLSNSDQNMKRMGFNFFFIKGDPKIKDDQDGEEVDEDGIKKKKKGRKNRHNMEVFVLATQKKVDYFISKNKIQKMNFNPINIDDQANGQKRQKVQIQTKVQQKVQPQQGTQKTTKIQESQTKQKKQVQQKPKGKKQLKKKSTLTPPEKQLKTTIQEQKVQKKINQEKKKIEVQEKKGKKKSKSQTSKQEKQITQAQGSKQKNKSKPKGSGKAKKKPILQSYSHTEEQKQEDAFDPKQQKKKKGAQQKKKKSVKKKVQTQSQQEQLAQSQD